MMTCFPYDINSMRIIKKKRTKLSKTMNDLASRYESKKKNTHSRTYTHTHKKKKTNNKPVIRVIDYGNVNNSSINHRWSKKRRGTRAKKKRRKKKKSTTDSSKVSSPSSIARERKSELFTPAQVS